jgi:hypothetical protein
MPVKRAQNRLFIKVFHYKMQGFKDPLYVNHNLANSRK